MLGYCNNNPVNKSDAGGELPVWVLPGVIGAGTSVSCAYIQGERGIDLLDDAFLGFFSGAFKPFATVYAICSAFDTGIEFAQKTGSTIAGIAVGVASYGVSQFTGENINKLNGNKLNGVFMDEAGMLFFDAFFGYGANVFATQALVELTPKPEVSHSATAPLHNTNKTQNRATTSVYYRNKTAALLGIH